MTDLSERAKDARKAADEADIEPGFCRCGCGAFVGFWKYNNPARGAFKGQPKKWVAGHNMTRGMTEEERFWEKVDKGAPGGCWEWTAYVSCHGYGYFGQGPSRRAHRYAYELTKGAIPEGLVLDHLCRNRKCVNPDHLEAVTNRTNTLRGETLPAAHASKTHCAKGHPFDEENTYERPSGGRACRICRRDADRRYKARRRADG